ncbi:MAG TPA: LppX_LprAFG lipoprotein [Acidimicrobiales bacterium]|nr:LppX_LprAFG lipoprotein [Acidimicrobiales bacterium]
MFRRRVLVSVALAAALAASAGACSKGDAVSVSKDPAAALAAAATRTAEGNSVKLDLSAKTASLTVATGNGAYDFDKKTGRFTLAGALLSNFDLIFTPDKVYIKTPQGPKKWAALTDAELANSGSTSFLASIRSQLDPRETLRNLGSGTKNAKVVGKEKVRGTDTTHVHADVDLSDAAIAKAPVDAQDSLRQARQSLGADSYPIDVWLDGDGRVRRLSYSLTVGEGTQRATTTVQLEFYDFGKDPGIVIPPASDVKEGVG